MDSTFKLNRSMRESADRIEAFCQSTVTGNFFTIDRQAIRLWSSEKQIKAVHFTELEYSPEVLGLEHLPSVDSFAAQIQSGNASHRFFSALKVWSSNLTLLYQVLGQKMRRDWKEVDQMCDTSSISIRHYI